MEECIGWVLDTLIFEISIYSFDRLLCPYHEGIIIILTAKRISLRHPHDERPNLQHNDED